MGKRIIILFFSALINYNISFAETGCAATDTPNPNIYTEHYTFAPNPPLYNLNGPFVTKSSVAQSNCSNYYYSISSTGPLGSCRLFYQTPSPGGTDYGYLVTYSPLCGVTFPVPLDDYIPLIVIGMGIFGFFLIRKRNLAI